MYLNSPRRLSSWPAGLLVGTALAVVAGCGSDGGMAVVKPVPTSALLADSNRDGVVDDKDKSATQAVWSATSGAIFLANVDDDDADGMADAADGVVNGAEDEKDLARVKIVPWAMAPMTATGTLFVDGALAGGAINLYRKDGATWTHVDLPATIAAADLIAGLELGIEAKDFVQALDPKVWDGHVVLRLTINDAGGTMPDGGLAESAVALRVAPYVMVNNLSPIFQVWNANYGDRGGLAFRKDLVTLTTAASADLEDASGLDDQWAEDWWQIGITFMPAVGGPHGMRVAQRSAQPDRGAGSFAQDQLAADLGFIWPHTDSPMGQMESKSYSLDSFGNHDTLPPYTKGSDKYPLGRIIVGGTKGFHIDPVVRAFYDAQAVQPVVQVDTTWLLVGHIDEIISYVPAKTARGWKLLVGSPKLARSMLQDISKAGHGADKMFSGKNWVDFNTNKLIPAAISVDALLADAEVMTASEVAQGKIDAVVAALKAEVGLTDDEIIEVPFLFERIQTGDPSSVNGYEFVAHMVGTVNLRSVNGVLGIPNPHGVVVDGMDYFQKDILDRLGTAKLGLGADGMGVKVTFVEDWDDYHVFDGEVHCGTTTGVTTMPTVGWWEAGR